MDFLKKLYYDPVSGFQSATKLYKKVREAGYKKLTLKQVQEWLNNQFTQQVHQQQERPKIFQTIISPEYGNNYQIDLMIYDRFEYRKYKYMLVVIDVYSRHLQIRPLTTREFPKIMDKLNDICDNMGFPKNVNCDNEFNTKEFKKWCKIHNITAWFSDPEDVQKNSIVERVNRTIAGMLAKWRTATGNYDWVKVLPKIVSNYNNTFHRTIKATPFQVKKGIKMNTQKRISFTPLVQSGDVVRLKKVRKVFDKGDVLTYSKDTFVVDKFKGNRLVLRNSTSGELKDKTYKPEDVKKIDDIIEDIRPTSVSRGERTLAEKKKERRIKKKLREEGVEVERTVRATRKTRRVPLAPTPKPASKKKRKAKDKEFDISEEDVFEAEKIVDSRKRKGKREYLVKWKGYSSRENTYEPAANLPKELIEAFKKKK